MASNTDFQFHVPGAYIFDNPPPFPAPRTGSPPLLSSVQSFGADVFRPPVASPSPSGSAMLGTSRSTPSSLFSSMSMTMPAAAAATAATPGIHAKRKRPANDSSREGTPLPSDWGHMSLETDGGGGDTRVVYTLAGQIDNGPLLRGSMDDSVYASAYADVDYRRALGPGGTGSAQPTAAGSTERAADADRWTVLHALGNVVGKVWEFCTTGAFRGFHAGGGAGYDWAAGRPTTASGTGTGGSSTDTRTEPAVAAAVEPLLSEDRSVRASTPTTPTQHVGKRRHVASSTGDELARSWVMVQQPERRGARRTTTGAVTPSAKTRTTTMRTTASSVSRGASPARPLPSNSSSNSRRPSAPPPPPPPPAPPSRRISTPVASRRTTGSTGPQPYATTTTATATATTATTPNSRLRARHAGSPGLQACEPASFASPRSPVASAPSPRRGVRANTLSSGQRPLSRSGSPAAAVAAANGGRMTPRSTQASLASLSVGGGAANPFARGAASPRPGSRAHQRSQSSLASVGGRGPRSMAARAAERQGRTVPEPPPPRKGYDDAALAASPRLTDEAKQLAAQQRAADADADAKMEAFNQRLQEMIRQGQEALGTRFEVDDGPEGGR